MKKIILFLLIAFHHNLFAQYKTDVLILGGTASGSTAALQAARSGVKSILVETNPFLIGEIAPDMNIPAYNFGIWKEWRDSCKKDIVSMQLDPRITLEKILKKEKKLQLFKETQVVKIKHNKNNWEVTISRNGKLEEIKTKVLVDAVFDEKNSPLINSGIVVLKEGYFETLVVYNPDTREKAYENPSKLYRTSGATGYGKDSSTHFFPIGAFISKEKDNLLFANSFASLKGFDEGTFRNVGLWANIGQMVGALAAYGPFFNTTTAKADVRVIQGEIITFKGILFPVNDVDVSDKAWYTIQKIIPTQLLKFDFITGKFNPDGDVFGEDVRAILSELHPRSRIWFIENKPEKLTIKQVISLISFISGKEIPDLETEISTDWKNRYVFKEDYMETNFINRKQLAVLFDNYLAPFSIKVNMAGYFLK